jgi:uncharacterized membrane protein
MKRFKTRSLALCGLLVLSASLIPFVASAQCPLIVVDCGGGHTYGCAGTPTGTNCSYSQSCITGGKCGGRAPVVPFNVE